MYILLSPTSFPDVNIIGVFDCIDAAARHQKKTLKRWKSVDVLLDWTEDENGFIKIASDRSIGIDLKSKSRVSIHVQRVEQPPWLKQTFMHGRKPGIIYSFYAFIDKWYCYRFNLDFLVGFS